MDLTKKVFSNIIFLLLDWFFVTLFSFFFWFIIGKTLLPDQYGIIVTTVNFMSLVSSISLLGFGNALNKLIPEFLQENKLDKIKDLIRFSTKITFASNIILVAILALFSSNFAAFMNVPTAAIWLGILILIFTSSTNLLGAILYGFQSMKKIFYTDVFGYAIKLVIALAYVFIGLKYSGALIAIAVSYLVITIIRINLQWYKAKGNNLDKKMVVSDYAVSAFISTIALTVFTNTQNIILSVLQGVSISGLFGIAMTLTLPIFSIPNILSNGLFPITSQLSAKKNNKSQQVYLISMVFRYSIFIALPIIIFMTFFSNALLLLFSRPEYLGASSLFLPLSFGALIYALAGLFSSSIYAIKKPKLQRNIVVSSAIVFLSLSIPMAFFFSSIGLSYAYLLSTVFYASIGFFYLRKHLVIKLPLNDLAKIFLGLFGLISTLIFTSGIHENILLKFVIGGGGVLLYLLILFAVKFYRNIDILILEHVMDRVPETKPLMGFLIKIISKNVAKD